MRRTNSVWVALAGLLVAASVFGGCSDSKQRKADRNLLKAVEQAEALVGGTYEYARQGGKLTAEYKPGAHELLVGAGGMNVSAESLPARTDDRAAEALARWILADAGRADILTDAAAYQTVLDKWRQAREVMKEVVRVSQARDVRVPDDLKMRAKEFRAVDLLPLPPEALDDLSPSQQRAEQAKANVVQTLGAENARERIVPMVVVRLAADAVKRYVAGSPDRGKAISGSAEQAEKVLAQWAQDPTVVAEIMAAGSVEMSDAVSALVSRQLADPAGREKIVGEMFGYSMPAETVANTAATAALKEAEDVLQKALDASADAGPKARTLAQIALARVVRMRGDAHALAAGAMRQRAAGAIDAAFERVMEASGQLDRIRVMVEAPLTGPKDGALGAADQKVTDGQAEVRRIQGEIADLQGEREALEQQKQDRSQKATLAYESVAAEPTEEAREARIAEFTRLQNEANALAQQADALGIEIKGKLVDLKVAQLNVTQAQAESAALSKAMEAAGEDMQGIRERRGEAVANLAVAGGQIRELESIITGALAQARQARQSARSEYARAAEAFSKAGAEGAAERAGVMISSGDLPAGAIGLQQRNLALAGSIIELLSRADEGKVTETTRKVRDAQVADPKEMAALLKEVEGAWAAEGITADSPTAIMAPETVRAEIIPSLTAPDELTQQAMADYEQAVTICNDALGKARGDAKDALLDTLAAAYEAQMRVSPNPAALRSAVENSDYLRELVTGEAPDYEPGRPMAALRRLRESLGRRAYRAADREESSSPGGESGTAASGGSADSGAAGGGAEAGPGTSTAGAAEPYTIPFNPSDAARTPKDAIMKMGAAVQQDRKDAFVACWDAADAEADALGKVFDYYKAIEKFQAAMTKTYGPDALQSLSLQGENLTTRKFMEGLSVKEEGDKAVVSSPGAGNDIELVRRDGVWKIVPGSMTDGKDLNQVAVLFEGLTGALSRVTGKIGQPGYTAAKINGELSVAIMNEMMKAAAAGQIDMDSGGAPGEDAGGDNP